MLNAVVRSKLLYGMESAHLISSILSRLNTVQLKGFRKIMKWQTTYVRRENTNVRLLEAVKQELREGQDVKLFSESYHESRRRLLGHILRLTDSQEEKNSTVRAHVPYPILNPVRRVGQPKHNWAVETMRKVWNDAHDPGGELDWEPYAEFDYTDRMHVQSINLMAHLRLL